MLNFSFPLEGNAAKRQRVYEIKNDNVAPLLLYTGPTLVDSRILCRMRAVKIVSARNMVKYQSAGRLPSGSQVCVEHLFDLQRSTPLRHFVALFPSRGRKGRYGIPFPPEPVILSAREGSR